jgi:nitric oxide reductase NorE protein
MTESINNKNSFLYPPGGILIWIIVMVEVVTFGIALITFRVNFENNYVEFINQQGYLHKTIGLINTIVLISSGFFMAKTLHKIKESKINHAKKWLIPTIFGGVLFLVLKSWEYSLAIGDGHVFGTTTFFNYYWMLTFFHFLHVSVGIIILSALFIRLLKGKYSVMDFETGGVFWHMCDLIWILLFPVLYLIH